MIEKITFNKNPLLVCTISTNWASSLPILLEPSVKSNQGLAGSRPRNIFMKFTVTYYHHKGNINKISDEKYTCCSFDSSGTIFDCPSKMSN